MESTRKRTGSPRARKLWARSAASSAAGELLATTPTKRRPGYANFTVADPPLKLVLIESAEARSGGVASALNHLGIEVETPEQVRAATQRLTTEGLQPEVQNATTCCYAVQDKAWARDPDGAPWEVYTVLADAPSGSGTDDHSARHGQPAPEWPAKADFGDAVTTKPVHPIVDDIGCRVQGLLSGPLALRSKAFSPSSYHR